MDQKKLESLSKDWGSYWEGRTGKATGTALVGIEKNPEINIFWQETLRKFPAEQAVLDLACGAGTVAKILQALSFKDISGVDISDAAIQVLRSEMPEVQGFVSPLESMPFDDDQFSTIVSQYGFEYGDSFNVIPEVDRLLRPGGQFLFLSHKADGAIHQEVSLKYTQMVALKDIHFIPSAVDLFTAAFSGETGRKTETILENFKLKRETLESLAQKQGGLALHLLAGARTMYERRQNYRLGDILAWFDGMQLEIDSFIGRMRSMKAAAIDEDRLTRIRAQFSDLGIVMDDDRVLKDKNKKELGWIISGRK